MSFFKRIGGRKAAGGRPTAPRFRPRLEALEGRELPTTLTVVSTADTGAGSLRAVVAAAADGDVITFARALRGQTITLTGGEIDITHKVTIEGPGAGRLEVSGNNAGRVFGVAAGTTVGISGLKIADGSAGQGGGIDNAGSLTLTGCVLTDNHATGDGSTPVRGGAVYNETGASLTIRSSTLGDNAANNGDGLAQGGAVYNAAGATLLIGNSALTGNRASGGLSGGGTDEGGAVYNAGDATVNRTTVSGNQASSGLSGGGTGEGGGIFNDAGATLSLRADTVTGNEANGGSGGTGVGGGVFNAGAPVSSRRTTIRGNAASTSNGNVFGPVV